MYCRKCGKKLGFIRPRKEHAGLCFECLAKTEMCQDIKAERQQRIEKLELLGATLKGAGSAMTPLGMITGWGQGDLKRLNAEKRQSAKMDELIAEVKKLREEKAIEV